tara:strand:- start:1628 stop:2821 length:1194 start_codon:yes stop_codon:yes gene_type:complete
MSWEFKKLGEVTELQGGSQPPKSTFKYEEAEGYLRLLQIRDFKSDDRAVFIPKSKKNRLCYENDILIGRYGASVGKICTGKKGAYNVALMKATPDKELLNTRLYLYYLKSKLFQDELASVSSRSAQNGFSKDDIKDFIVPIPPLPVQKQIVETLDKAFEKIDKAIVNIERNIENAEELFQSKMEKLLFKESDDRKNSTIGEVCELMTGGTPSKKKKEYFEKGDINWLVSGDIHKKEIQECNGKITSLGLEKSNAKYLPVNSVMIALNGQGKTRGTVAMLRIKATCNQSLVSIYPKDLSKLTPEFIYVNLDSRYIEIRKLTGDSGNDRRGLNMPLLKKISLSIPKSIEEQKNIIESFYILKNNTDSIVENNSKKISLLNDLKKSILEKAFKEELTSAA